ncbi:cupin domain-containing protein [Aurantivibrio plasticivorans]
MLNMNFNERVVIETRNKEWQASPKPGVLRKPLAREEAERGHATSIIRYEAGAHFHKHGHPLGEEIFVLDGVFSDETGDYPAGTYIRNPKGFKHAPFSREGCTLFVKLHQFQTGDTTSLSINTNEASWVPGEGHLDVMPLHQFNSESVALVRWPAGEKFDFRLHAGGEEILVISGEFIDESGRYPKGTWIRNPHLSLHKPYVEETTLIWLKTGHLHNTPIH